MGLPKGSIFAFHFGLLYSGTFRELWRVCKGKTAFENSRSSPVLLQNELGTVLGSFKRDETLMMYQCETESLPYVTGLNPYLALRRAGDRFGIFAQKVKKVFRKIKHR